MIHVATVLLLAVAGFSSATHSHLSDHHHKLLKRLALMERAPAGICPPQLGSSPISYYVKSSMDASLNGTVNWSGLTAPLPTRGNGSAVQVPYVRQTPLIGGRGMSWFFSNEVGTGSYTLSTTLSKPHVSCLKGTGANKGLLVAPCSNSTTGAPVYDHSLPFMTICSSCSTTGGQNCLFISDQYGGCLNFDGQSGVTLSGCDWSKSSELWTISVV